MHGADMDDLPHDAAVVEFYVKYMAHMAAAELAEHLASVHIPHLDRLIIARTHETATAWVKRQRAHE